MRIKLVRLNQNGVCYETHTTPKRRGFVYNEFHLMGDYWDWNGVLSTIDNSNDYQDCFERFCCKRLKYLFRWHYRLKAVKAFSLNLRFQNWIDKIIQLRRFKGLKYAQTRAARRKKKSHEAEYKRLRKIILLERSRLLQVFK